MALCMQEAKVNTELQMASLRFGNMFLMNRKEATMHRVPNNQGRFTYPNRTLLHNNHMTMKMEALLSNPKKRMKNIQLEVDENPLLQCVCHNKISHNYNANIEKCFCSKYLLWLLRSHIACESTQVQFLILVLIVASYQRKLIQGNRDDLRAWILLKHRKDLDDLDWILSPRFSPHPGSFMEFVELMGTLFFL